MIKLPIGEFSRDNSKLVWKSGKQIVWIEPWGYDSIRVRSTQCSTMPVKNWALLKPISTEFKIIIEESTATIINGSLEAKISKFGQIVFFNNLTKKILCSEKSVDWLSQHPRSFKYKTNRLFHAELTLDSFEDEKIYGMGQHKNGYLNQKNCVIDLIHTNSEVTIPFILSNRGYGFIWHNPGIGRVEFGKNHTRWVAKTTSIIDYIVISGKNPEDILEKYNQHTGFPPKMPEWAAGFWQSKLRYRTQNELLKVAKEYKKRNLPISVIVIDFFHWTLMGDYQFDYKNWPDPKAMVEELEKMGIKVLVSIWPTININSKNYDELSKKGYLIQTKNGHNVILKTGDTYGDPSTLTACIDTTNPEARKYLWNIVKKNYYDYGIKLWWLDAIEPETQMFKPHDNFVFYEGDGEEVALLYPLGQQIGFYEGMKKENEKDIVTLCRSGFLGSQRFGASIWSGDIQSTFKSLKEQVKAGLNMAISGIPWWHTDIGGFEGGNIDSEYFKELIIRWFQFGVFCPICRLHGYRTDNTDKYDSKKASNVQTIGGADNEVWSFGDKEYDIICKYMRLRERLKPYILKQMEQAHTKGTPVMRPLFFDFYEDIHTYDIEDSFMFGTDILVSPVLNQGETEKEVYLPKNTKWTYPYNKATYEGGKSITIDAPLEIIPIFIRYGSKLASIEDWYNS